MGDFGFRAEPLLPLLLDTCSREMVEATVEMSLLTGGERLSI